jgi:hypothetical protein
MKRCSLVIAFLLIGYFPVTLMAQGKFRHLKDWVGKYPTFNDTKPHKEFLKLPVIQKSLLHLLPSNDYRFLTKTCGKEVPIKMIGDFLIIRRCHHYACAYGSAVLLVNLQDGAMHIAIRNEKDEEQRWFSTNGKYKELPFDVQRAWTIEEH